MLDLIRDMLTSPGSPADTYGWGAALLAHAFIGVILTALIRWIAGAWRGATITTGGYLLLWEGAQVAFFGGGIPDGLVDAAAVACGAVVAAGAWRNRGGAAAAALALLAVIGIAGVRNRR
ncbi:hypothetical protein [Paracoccus hibiscisoli]|uniref:Uncharacterized protein n=1 Tax=Paracoccus hibiscisoli TaxID=2023261 RepID=A0A4U0Q6U4_9RHOB|nr:hypothetical protein [Paracoccus hibiscisoli]TJZ76865.1 hypothetical protein FA740_19315 [Paracoccus hibiscisoli]